MERFQGRAIGAWLAVVAALCVGPASADINDLAGSHWAIVEVYGEVLPGDDIPFIAFEERNRLSGRTACNWFHGSYSLEADEIVLLTRLTTLRGCEVEGKRRRDPTLEALDSSHGYQIAGAVLTLTDSDGVAVARLEKQGDD